MNAFHVITTEQDYILDAYTLHGALVEAFETTGSGETIISVKPLGAVL